ncbi:hypothetical protein Tco_0794147 [Tanacetum coccineum]
MVTKQQPFKRQTGIVAKSTNMGDRRKKPYGGGKGTLTTVATSAISTTIAKGNGANSQRIMVVLSVGAPGHFKKGLSKTEIKDEEYENAQGWVYAGWECRGKGKRGEMQPGTPDANVITGRKGRERFLVNKAEAVQCPSLCFTETEKVIAYASRQLKVHEKNYTTHDLGSDRVVVFALKNYGGHFSDGTRLHRVSPTLKAFSHFR